MIEWEDQLNVYCGVINRKLEFHIFLMQHVRYADVSLTFDAGIKFYVFAHIRERSNNRAISRAPVRGDPAVFLFIYKTKR
jgi:hypothetical protein